MLKSILFLLLFVSADLSSQGQYNRFDQDSVFLDYFKNHKTIAVLPFRVESVLRPKVERKMPPAQKALMEYTLGYDVQETIIKVFSNKQNDKSALFSIQDSSLTNQILKEAGINQNNYTDFSPQELGELLRVDAVISGNLKTWKPIGSGWAYLLNTTDILDDDDDIVDDFSNNKVPAIIGEIEIYLVNTKDESVLWKYNGSNSVGGANDMNGLIAKIIRRSAKSFPYFYIKN